MDEKEARASNKAVHAIAKHGIRIAACNAHNSNGNRLRQDRRIREGACFPVVEFFRVAGGCSHGSRAVRVRDEQGNILTTYAEYFEYREDKPG